MMYKALSIAICYVIFLLPFTAFSSPLTEDEELRERCEKRSGEWFEKRHGSGCAMIKDVLIMSHYRNHYNKKMKKCFILTRTDYFSTNTGDERFSNLSLCDVNENIHYGSVVITGSKADGKLLGRACASEQEWVSFVTPYMDE
mgnify:CR=1 FL=1